MARSKKRKRFVQVGLGGRSAMYSWALLQKYSKTCELVGLCDSNPGRIDNLNSAIVEGGGTALPTASPRQFASMVKDLKADTVVVTSMDSTHSDYIVRAMELGCNVITEKPMTTDAKRCQRIIDTAAKTGKSARVTFNYRYSPPRVQLKELIAKGLIGKVLSVDFEWALNTSHGADYFRRWHRNKKNSGGLMVHKATHHFDLVNWWMEASPVEVYAAGARSFYGAANGMAEEYGLTGHAERCLDCKSAIKRKCKFHLDMKKHESMRHTYLDCEEHDGYFRDRCVFSSQIDIEDTMHVIVHYDNGAIMSYNLNAFLPWEGYRVSFNGTKGRLEQLCVETVYISGDGTVQGETIPTGTHINYYPHFKKARSIRVRTGKGGHGGGDAPLLDDVFAPEKRKKKDPLNRAAGIGDGARSILVGVAANKCFKTNKPVKISSLVKNIPPACWE